MDEIDYRTIRALARCSFAPGSWTKRFVRNLAGYPRERALSEKQRAALARVAWHYRKQLARHGIAVKTRPPDVFGVDKQAQQHEADLEQLRKWNEGEPLRPCSPLQLNRATLPALPW